MTNETKIIYMGTPEIAADILKRISGVLPIFSVVTQPDKPQGRTGGPVAPAAKETAKELNISVFQPKTTEELTDYIREQSPDLLIVAAFGMMLPESLLKIPVFGSLNVHPSLLPEYRGPTPLEAPILNGDSKTGVTIMEIVERMDAGPIVAQREIELSGLETVTDLEKKAAELGAEMLITVIPKWLSHELTSVEQPENATYTRKIQKEDGRINFSTETAEKIERKSRAYEEWPGTYAFWNDKKIDFKNIETQLTRIELGSVVESEGKIIIGTLAGSFSPGMIKLEGKKWVTAEEFLRGYPSFNGSKLT